MNGCCYGAPTDLPWAIHYPVGHQTHPVGQEAIGFIRCKLYESLLNFCSMPRSRGCIAAKNSTGTSSPPTSFAMR